MKERPEGFAKIEHYYQTKPSGRSWDAVYHEKPSATLERLSRLEKVMMDEIGELKRLFK